MIEYVIGLFVVLLAITLAWKLLKSIIKVVLVGVVLVIIVYGVLTFMDINSTDEFNETMRNLSNTTDSENVSIISETFSDDFSAITGKVTDTYKQKVVPKAKSSLKSFLKNLLFNEV